MKPIELILNRILTSIEDAVSVFISMLKRHIYIFSVLSLFLTTVSFNLASDTTVLQTNADRSNVKNYKFINGHWFDGKSFYRKTFYSVNGILTEKKPRRVDEVFDLADGFVIPPFAEAHNHNIEGDWDIEIQIRNYLRDGVFYVKIPSNIRQFTEQIQNKINHPQSVDVVFSNGALTASGGHPVTLYEDILSKSQYKDVIGKVERGWFNNKGYFIIDDETDLQNKWAAIRAGKPDFIKTILSFSEDFEKNRDNPSPYVRKGLNPKLLPMIVEKAHSDGLRVSTHVETAPDFHNALAAGADEINHLPCYYIHTPDQAYRCPISEEDAQMAGRKGVFVVTTTVLSNSILRDPKLLPLVRENQIKNLRLLHKYGVKIAVGSDHSDTSLAEALNLYDLKVFDNLTLLKLWCEVTPGTIFPKRKIGRLKEGYEAGFLVLDDNPLENFMQVKEIRMRFKQGQPIEISR